MLHVVWYRLLYVSFAWRCLRVLCSSCSCIVSKVIKEHEKLEHTEFYLNPRLRTDQFCMVVLSGMKWYGVCWYDMLHDMTCHGMTCYYVVWYYMVWCSPANCKSSRDHKVACSRSCDDMIRHVYVSYAMIHTQSWCMFLRRMRCEEDVTALCTEEREASRRVVRYLRLTNGVLKDSVMHREVQMRFCNKSRSIAVSLSAQCMQSNCGIPR